MHSFYYPVSKREVVDIVALHLEGEAGDWWFNHLSHMKVFAYADFFQRLKKKFCRKKLETYHIETSPIIEEILNEDQKKMSLLSLRRRSLFHHHQLKMYLHKEEEHLHL